MIRSGNGKDKGNGGREGDIKRQKKENRIRENGKRRGEKGDKDKRRMGKKNNRMSEMLLIMR